MTVASYTYRKLPREEFPSQLLEIPQPPEQLWLSGNLPSTDTALLAVVGSRRHTTYGKEVCEKIIQGLADFPVAIVSGLALGIDSIAHRAAMAVGLPTIAIPGSGLHPSVLYPRSHVKLAEEIVEKGGALLTEFEPDFVSTLWGFPKRNRIMAGLCKAVLVVEADDRSGTLITARLALEYNRDVFAVPHNMFGGNATGVNRLLKQGALAITKPEDIVTALGFEVAKDEGGSDESEKEKMKDLSEDERKIWDILFEPTPRDEIIRHMGGTASETNSLLMVMEIKGLIKEELGEMRRG
ncbi:DNA-processing protein DprA [bacterium]|nr:DNA-processing protein DprA [bacterium]